MKPLAQHEAFRAIAGPLLVGVVLLALWQGLCAGLKLPSYVFPAPSDIAASLAANAPALLSALLRTLRVTLEALVLAVVFGAACGFLFVQSRAIERCLFPYAVLLQVTPVVAVAPLLIILFQNTDAALTFCAVLVAIFPMISNTTIGLRSVDPGLLAYFRMNKIGRWRTLVLLRIPSALPFFLAGLRISSGLALLGAVVAEFVAGTGGQESGLAYEILQSGYQLDLPRMFAALLLIALSGVALFSLTTLLERLLLDRWHASAASPER
jgi:NitT/TauT family transport system permease protein